MKYSINTCPIYISSSDAYSDLWPIFFELFKKFWPEYTGVLYLNTECKTYSFDGLNIVCTTVGRSKSFGKTFRDGLEKIDTTNVLLIMIDYFFMGNVNHDLLNDYYEFFVEKDFDSICLTRNSYTNSQWTGYKNIFKVNAPSENMFSYQIGFWKKDVLYKMALPHESPWLSEWYGTLRANTMNINLAHIDGTQVIPYLDEGALHKGKWVSPMVKFLDENSYKINYQTRGFFIGDKTSVLARLKARVETFVPRLLSNIHLAKLKYLR
jgi:hypothetical protein